MVAMNCALYVAFSWKIWGLFPEVVFCLMDSGLIDLDGWMIVIMVVVCFILFVYSNDPLSYCMNVVSIWWWFSVFDNLKVDFLWLWFLLYVLQRWLLVIFIVWSSMLNYICVLSDIWWLVVLMSILKLCSRIFIVMLTSSYEYLVSGLC